MKVRGVLIMGLFSRKKKTSVSPRYSGGAAKEMLGHIEQARKSAAMKARLENILKRDIHIDRLGGMIDEIKDRLEKYVKGVRNLLKEEALLRKKEEIIDKSIKDRGLGNFSAGLEPQDLRAGIRKKEDDLNRVRDGLAEQRRDLILQTNNVIHILNHIFEVKNKVLDSEARLDIVLLEEFGLVAKSAEQEKKLVMILEKCKKHYKRFLALLEQFSAAIEEFNEDINRTDRISASELAKYLEELYDISNDYKKMVGEFNDLEGYEKKSLKLIRILLKDFLGIKAALEKRLSGASSALSAMDKEDARNIMGNRFIRYEK